MDTTLFPFCHKLGDLHTNTGSSSDRLCRTDTVRFPLPCVVAVALNRPARIGAVAALAFVALAVASMAQAQSAEALAPHRSACASGWDQLLSPQQRAVELQLRGCAATPASPRRGVLAAQMGVYRRPVAVLPSTFLAPGASGGEGAFGSGVVRRSYAQMSGGGAQGSPALLAPLVDRVARDHDIDPLLLHAIARVESRHQPGAVSHAGAHGLMQVIVPTARRFGVDEAKALHDPDTNLQVSALYLKTLQRRFGNDLKLVLAAYNAGEAAVEKHGRRIPPYRETQDYVRKVLAEYALLLQVRRQQAVSESAALVPGGLL